MIKREIEICGKKIPFRSSATIPRLYRAKFKRDIFKDLSKLEKSYVGTQKDGAEFQIDDITVRTAVVSGLGNTRALMKKIERGEVHYDFVEVMACPGGCVGGGGQPIHDGEERAFERGKRLYQLDADAKIRYSHDNPDIKRLYEEYFGEPNEHKAHMLLHTDHLESMERYGTGYRNYREE